MNTATLTVEGCEILLDQDDCLCDLNDWSESVAQALAVREGIELSEAHWEVLYLLRKFYQTFQLSPANRALVKYVAVHLGKEKGNSLYLNALFNGKPAKLAARLAGLPKPANCF
ncbi:TusE/DsrC/DsvC family sulfur relay protein [Denitrificimonas sp. JX-1]|uniref:Sulfurtransferase n=1 Tax=Denitrificimonas halotolerans TaxID=3098930 RepID=A0ABU5GRJ1_9GAMM|nr:TusE/DsrC/DsvC family sulfur relay protein [Denitrificimonas sp. JX-1]MDY7219611.1 TusE/DsrC/DsvC family sulfur relay protein [Denitrificimonas sp. JX-1]